MSAFGKYKNKNNKRHLKKKKKKPERAKIHFLDYFFNYYFYIQTGHDVTEIGRHTTATLTSSWGEQRGKTRDTSCQDQITRDMDDWFPAPGVNTNVWNDVTWNNQSNGDVKLYDVELRRDPQDSTSDMIDSFSSRLPDNTQGREHRLIGVKPVALPFPDRDTDTI